MSMIIILAHFSQSLTLYIREILQIYWYSLLLYKKSNWKLTS